ESVIYSSVMSCILASMASLRTRVVAFDTNIIDLTEKCEDPVDLLFGFQLGGGTNIEQSVAYCEKYIENPSKTLFFLISDLEEGGNRAGLLRRLEEMKASGVTAVCLLALADGGKPYYDAQMANRIAGLGIPCFACNPEMLPQLLERALSGQDLLAFEKEFEKRKR
ncbi:MAG: VWA domain-containing protein, partial [Lachnospiraceae bacterium]|nr:VWA domain-containing protein [Lachnospiraceae bacterium]